MSRTEHIRLMAKYNEWLNARLYAAAMSLSDDKIATNQKAFFGSLLGTLNHLAVGDTIWLKRFATHPANYSALEPVRSLASPLSLDQLLYSDIQSLSNYRKSLDQVILAWAHSIKEDELDHALHYASVKGIVADKNFFSLVMNLFNHQTHHRGQATTLLFQAGVDIGVTDLLAIMPNKTGA